MNNISALLLEARLADLDRNAANARHKAALRDAAHPGPAPTRAVTIRVVTPDDASALKRLAELDSSEVPACPVLVAEVGGELRAAVSLSDRAIIADPFQPTAPLVQLLLKYAEQVLGDRSPRLRRFRDALSMRARRHRQTATAASAARKVVT
jgi:hypothetical protein